MIETVQDAVEVFTVWKPGALRDAAVALVRAGVERLDAGEDFFGPDDVPEDFAYGGQGVCGSAIHALRAANVIKDYWGPTCPGGRRRSRRPSANGRKVSLYQLTTRAVAGSFLRRNGVAVEARQMEMAI